MSFVRLDDLGRKLEAIEHAQAMLSVDEAVNMPSGGGEKRAEAMGVLAALYHETATHPQVADWLAVAESETLNADQRVAVKEFRRVHTNMTCLSSAFVQRQVNERVRAEQLWRSLRAQNDWTGFLPAFAGVVSTMREEAQRRAEALRLAPYDALIEQYDPGSRAAAIAPLFDELKQALKVFIPEALEDQRAARTKHPLKRLNGPFAIADQKALGQAMMAAIGFDFEHGRLDVSHHPFCGGVPSDVRMTTRYVAQDFLPALLGILHETGHGLYEQGLPQAWSHWPSGKARGMALHESQSLFVEKQIAKSPEFWTWAMPLVRQHLGAGAFEGWHVDDLLPHIQTIKPGFIRVDADEATYPLHIILRFELEQGLVSGALAAKDVPEAWDAKMRDYLGLSTIDTPKDGPMQDVHWPSGAFGYFPSYTLGALLAAQMAEAIARDVPDFRAGIAKGNFAPVMGWLRDHVWSRASMHAMPGLIANATGGPLSAKPFLAHLRRRYLKG